jgi:hypothetical protein
MLVGTFQANPAGWWRPPDLDPTLLPANFCRKIVSFRHPGSHLLFPAFPGFLPNPQIRPGRPGRFKIAVNLSGALLSQAAALHFSGKRPAFPFPAGSNILERWKDLVHADRPGIADTHPFRPQKRLSPVIDCG